MASKGKKVAPAMRKSARAAKANQVGYEGASALSHSSSMQTALFLIVPVLQKQWKTNKLDPGSDSIENGAPVSTLYPDEAASTSISARVSLRERRVLASSLHSIQELACGSQAFAIAPIPDPTVAIQLSFRADLDLFLTKSPSELPVEQYISKAKARYHKDDSQNSIERKVPTSRSARALSQSGGEDHVGIEAVRDLSYLHMGQEGDTNKVL